MQKKKKPPSWPDYQVYKGGIYHNPQGEAEKEKASFPTGTNKEKRYCGLPERTFWKGGRTVKKGAGLSGGKGGVGKSQHSHLTCVKGKGNPIEGKKE